MNTDLSAFYFDIRKDALYCEPYSSAKRRAALDDDRADLPLRHAVAGADPVASPPRRPGSRAIPPRTARCTWRLFPAIPEAWRDDALAEKWEQISACAASSPARSRSSAPASASARRWRRRPRSIIADAELLDGARRRRPRRGLHHLGHRRSSTARPPDGAFTLPDVPGVGVVPSAAAGQEVRPLLAHHRRRRQRPGLPRPLRPRRRRRARVRCARNRAPKFDPAAAMHYTVVHGQRPAKSTAGASRPSSRRSSRQRPTQESWHFASSSSGPRATGWPSDAAQRRGRARQRRRAARYGVRRHDSRAMGPRPRTSAFAQVMGDALSASMASACPRRSR